MALGLAEDRLDVQSVDAVQPQHYLQRMIGRESSNDIIAAVSTLPGALRMRTARCADQDARLTSRSVTLLPVITTSFSNLLREIRCTWPGLCSIQQETPAHRADIALAADLHSAVFQRQRHRGVRSSSGGISATIGDRPESLRSPGRKANLSHDRRQAQPSPMPTLIFMGSPIGVAIPSNAISPRGPHS